MLFLHDMDYRMQIVYILYRTSSHVNGKTTGGIWSPFGKMRRQVALTVVLQAVEALLPSRRRYAALRGRVDKYREASASECYFS